VTSAPVSPDGAALPRRLPWARRRLLHLLLAAVAALLAYVVWRAYRDPALVIDLANGFVIC